MSVDKQLQGVTHATNSTADGKIRTEQEGISKSKIKKKKKEDSFLKK